MISRRKLLAVVGTVASGPALFRPGSLGVEQSGSGSFALLGADVANAASDVEPKDLAQIGAHVYSEEGIPMFLACENTAAAPASSAAERTPSDLNRKVSSAFERYTHAWQHAHPHAPASDVAKVVELLAGRDFASGGLETSL
jgi:hypothetical protein